ncbi:MAG: hypothetical protein V4675_11935 [Verrucomicrobiota bacterium]
MLAFHITEALRSAFPEVPFILSSPPDPVATLDGPCAELSPLQICDDGDEATIYLGTTTHGHLGCYDEGLSEDQKHRQIADDVIDFVRDVFSDRIVASSSLGGRIGGWRRLCPEDDTPGPSMFKRQYVWSRPLQ